jgi:hypothetical protein
VGFLIFAPLTFLLLRLTVRWRWRSILLTAAIVGLVADFVFDLMVARRS